MLWMNSWNDRYGSVEVCCPAVSAMASSYEYTHLQWIPSRNNNCWGGAWLSIIVFPLEKALWKSQDDILASANSKANCKAYAKLHWGFSESGFYFLLIHEEQSDMHLLVITNWVCSIEFSQSCIRAVRKSLTWKPKGVQASTGKHRTDEIKKKHIEL